jgi:NitT/TauT family transport system substrate-binding protein
MASRSRFHVSRWTVPVLILITLLALPTWGTRGGSSVSASSAKAGMTKVKIAFSTWTGYGPLVVAVEKGFFKKRGLDVSYNVVQDPSARKAAIQANHLDGAASTVDTFTRWAAQGTPIQMVLGIDFSAGGDGIVAKKSITTVRQLKGKSVAVATGTVSEFFFDYVLQKNGMSINDVQLKDMPDSSVSGSTFAAGKVDAAVTWEPWLTRAAHTGFGHILVSSAKYPTIIVDALVLRTDFIKAHPSAVQNLVRAYYEAVNYTKSDPADAYKVIGKYVSETPAQVGGDLKKVPLFNLAKSKSFFGTASNPGQIYNTARFAGKFWLRLKKINKMPNLNQLINSTFLQQM